MLRTLSLVAALGMPSLSAFAAEEASKPEPKPERPRIQVFRLKIVEPNDALQAFNALKGIIPDGGAVPVPIPTGPLNVLPPVLVPPAAPQAVPQGAVFQIQAQDPPQAPAFPPPVIGSGPATRPTPIPPAPVCRALADPRTRSLIVRGTAKDLEFAADLVAVLDTPENKPLPAVKSLKAFRLEHLDAVDFVGILQALDTNITYRLVPIGRMKLVLATGTDEQMKELADAVKELDIPGK